MSDFSVPDFDDVKEFGSVVEKGWHPASLANMIAKNSKSGNPMLVGDFVIDAGDFMGSKLKDYFVVGGESNMGWEKLKSLASAANFRWKAVPTKEKLAAQFTDADVLESPLRLEIKIDHSFSIKEGEKWKNVSKEGYDRWRAQGGDGNVRAEIKDYRTTTTSPVLNVTFAVAEDEQETGFMPSSDRTPSPAPSVDRDDDDDLPF